MILNVIGSSRNMKTNKKDKTQRSQQHKTAKLNDKSKLSLTRVAGKSGGPTLNRTKHTQLSKKF